MLSLHTATDVQDELATLIKTSRKAKKWSVDTLSQRAGVPYGTIRKYESTGNISLRQFLMLCEALGKLDELRALAKEKSAMPKSIDDVLRDA